MQSSKMPNDRPISIRVSNENEEDSDYDLYKALYIFDRLNSFGKTRQAVYKKMKAIRNQRQFRALITQKEKPRYDTLRQIAMENDVQLIFWDQARRCEAPKILHSVVVSHLHRAVHLVAPYLTEAFEYKLSDLHLVLDIDRFNRKISHETQGNFWMCLEMSDFVGCECWQQIPHAWGSDFVDLTREPKFIAFFGFGFTIFMAKRVYRGSKTDIVYKRVHKTRLPHSKRFINLEYVGEDWPEDKTLITSNDQFIIRSKDYFRVLSCPNDYCNYNTTRQFNLDRHIKSCSDDTVVEYKQTILTDTDLRDWCVKRGYIPEAYFSRNFATFDIESVGVQANENFGDSSKILSLQRVVSVSVTKTFGSGQKTKVIIRQSSSEEDYEKFIKEFVNHIFALQIEFQDTLPNTLLEAIKYMEDEIIAFKARERNYSINQIKQFRTALNYLEKQRKLFVYGFNSQSYDLCVLFSGILKYAKYNGFKFDVIKRGNQLMSLRLGNIVFCDCLNFAPGVSLDSFGSMWGATASKGCFPYELYHDISEMEEAVYWPRLKDFKSSLNRKQFSYSSGEISDIFQYADSEIHCTEIMFTFMTNPSDNDECSISVLSSLKFPICLRTYVENWILYTKSLNNGTMTCMKDYLAHYNSIDTELLADGFQNYVNSFIENFKISPIGFLSLPALSEMVMWRQFDKSKNAPYSFAGKFGFLNEMLRENLIGGLASVFKRHVEVGDCSTKYADCVHLAPNGQPFSRLVAYDANSKLSRLKKNEILTGSKL